MNIAFASETACIQIVLKSTRLPQKASQNNEDVHLGLVLLYPVTEVTQEETRAFEFIVFDKHFLKNDLFFRHHEARTRPCHKTILSLDDLDSGCVPGGSASERRLHDVLLEDWIVITVSRDERCHKV